MPSGERMQREEGAAKVERFEQRLAEQNKRIPSSNTEQLFDSSQPRADSSLGDVNGVIKESVAFRKDALQQLRVQDARRGRLGGGGYGGGGLGGLFGGRALGDATGFASLDVQLPQRGLEYRFTTPRGNIEINARVLDNSLWFRLQRLAIVTGMILLVAFCVRIIHSVGYERLLGPKPAALLLVIGFCMLLFGVAPVLGGIALVVGIILIVRWYFAHETNVNSVTT